MKTIAALILTGALLSAAESTETKRQTFSGVREVILDNITGPIEVAGHTGATVELEYTRKVTAESGNRLEAANRDVKMEPRQDADRLRLFVDTPSRCGNCGGGYRRDGYTVRYDFKLKVPFDTRLDLRTVNEGTITVRDTAGDFDIRNINGAIHLAEVSGSGTADALNGAVTVTYARNPQRESLFKSLNGTVEVSFQPGLNADLRLKTFNGSAYTDFEVTALPSPAGSSSREGVRYVYKRNRMSSMRAGAGGPVLTFDAFNGDIKIRKRER
ncbi:MAG: hypothetical protein K2X35_08610 [Bryobacteraceae bacterium]|nr:hypothetical protein [Bryobacteraceae bacterium]